MKSGEHVSTGTSNTTKSQREGSAERLDPSSLSRMAAAAPNPAWNDAKFQHLEEQPRPGHTASFAAIALLHTCNCLE